MKYRLIAANKINEIKKDESNLSNKNFDFYIPKKNIKKFSSNLREKALFPGYIFINTRTR